MTSVTAIVRDVFRQARATGLTAILLVVTGVATLVLHHGHIRGGSSFG